MVSRMSFRVMAPAKVNLSLRIVGKRADGYHLLDSLVAFAACGDYLAFCPSENFSVTIDGPMASSLAGMPEDRNLIFQAARVLAERLGHPLQGLVRLTKILPVGGGIGGGSSDAAATLLGLTRLWGGDLPQSDLLRLALTLGADVPVCLRGHAARMSGIGEILESVPPLPEAWLVLVNPGVTLSTPAVFRAYDGSFSDPAPVSEPLRDSHDLAKALRWRGNDLTRAALSLAPEVARCLSALEQAPQCLLAQMSGSGSTCWGLFSSGSDAFLAARVLRRFSPSWWIKATRLVETVNRVSLFQPEECIK